MEEISGKGIRATFPEGTVLLGNYTLMEMYQVDTTGYEKGGYGSEVLLAVDGVLEGFVIVADEIKTDAAASVSKMKALGIATVMLTGDEKNSAQAVAKETGIDEVYAQLLPQEKLEHLKNVRKNHGAVMFVGDGINDAPVLAGADVGSSNGKRSRCSNRGGRCGIYEFFSRSNPTVYRDCEEDRKYCNSECSICAGDQSNCYDSWFSWICEYVACSIC